jgi:hypothetical protein
VHEDADLGRGGSPQHLSVDRLRLAVANEVEIAAVTDVPRKAMAVSQELVQKRGG